MPQGTPNKIGYTFDGWAFDFSTKLTQDTAISAKWKANTYTVTLDAKGGSLPETVIQIVYGERIELPVPTLAGSVFTGWYDGSKAFTSGIFTETKNLTLIAKWDHHDYKITYDPNGGTVDKTLQGVSYGDTYTTPTPIRAGYTFVGWYCDGNPVYTSRYLFEEDKTYIARWEERRYSASFVTNGGETLPSGE